MTEFGPIYKHDTKNCPINERTGDSALVGRCWYALADNICPRHGDVSKAVEHFNQTGKLTKEILK
jgi:hypothetical protein